MANDSPSIPPPQYSQPPTTEDRAEFDRLFGSMFASEISIADPFGEALWEIRCEIHDVISRVVGGLIARHELDANGANVVMFWLYANYPGLPASVLAHTIPYLSEKQHARIRHTMLQYSSGTFLRRDVEGLRALPYAEYLQTEHWLALRADALDRAAGCCQVCKSSLRLNVHHNTYERRGEEIASDLIVLCADCHELFHKSGRVQS